MHAQLIRYRWVGDVDEFMAGAEPAAPVIAAMDGFVAKYWLRADGGVFASVYLWRDKEAADAYANGEFLRTALVELPGVRDLEVEDYELWEAPTAVTTAGLAATPT
jgi:heme-degrading monooxygenase HmoA